MEYRKAVLSDVDTLSRMRAAMLSEEEKYTDAFQALIYENTKKYMENGIRDNMLTAFVAVDNSCVIAMGSVTYFLLPPNDWCPDGDTAYIGSMYTLPAYRKQGLASQILSLILDETKARMCQRILLNTTDMGKPLYDKFGFASSPTAMALHSF